MDIAGIAYGALTCFFFFNIYMLYFGFIRYMLIWFSVILILFRSAFRSVQQKKKLVLSSIPLQGPR